MTKTTKVFLEELKSQPLSSYTLIQLQLNLQKCANYYRRFKGEDDREALNYLWNKMGEMYNDKLTVLYSTVNPIYKANYLKNEL